MKLTDKILKMKQDMSDFDKEVLTKLREIDGIISVVDDGYLFDGHIIDFDIEDNKIALEVDYGGYNTGYAKVPFRYFDMSKEELIEEKQRLEKAREEKNKQRIAEMYVKKLEELERTKDQIRVLNAEVEALKVETEELKRLSA